MTDSPAAAPRQVLGMSATQALVAVVVALTLLRFAIAPLLPLAFDEAYYWRWSLFPSAGYLDHPPLVAWGIRLGTEIAGDNPFGVRLVPLVLSVLASIAVWRTANVLFGRNDLALTAAVYFNLTLIVSVGMVIATPDALLLAAAAFLAYSLAKLAETGRPVWWIAAGVFTGLGLLSKYTALFWLPSILIWIILTPRIRPWLATIWPWAGAAVALLVFLPNLVWNATNDWLTFDKQFGRVTADGLNPEFLLDHLGQQIGLATPLVFMLGWVGLGVFLARRGGPTNARILLGALVWPTTLYFIFHAFHSQVEGNWTGSIMPAFVIAAAAAFYWPSWRGWAKRLIGFAGRWAIPTGAVLLVAIYAQALTGVLPLGTSDPTVSRLGAGVSTLADEVEELRSSEGATAIITADYGTTSWLSYYSIRPDVPVLQFNEPDRWLQEERPDEAALTGPAIAVLHADADLAAMEEALGPAEWLTTLTRRRGDLVIESYEVYRLPPRQ